jgi:CheY-like chemotaxis protein
VDNTHRQQDIGAATTAGASPPEVLAGHESLVWNLLNDDLIVLHIVPDGEHVSRNMAAVDSWRLCMARVLIVEDEEPVRNLLRIALEFAGYDVIEACNGLDGLTISHQTDIGLIITDLEMPVMDGITMLSTLRSEDANIPVIVLSGCGQEMLDSARACGVQYVFQKPFYIKEFLNTVHLLMCETATGVPER